MPHPPATRASLLIRLTDPADEAAWGEFLRVYGPLVLAVIRRKGFGHVDAEDLTQRVFARVFRGLRTFEYAPSRGRFRDWLGTIVYREVLREYRSRGRERASLVAPGELDSIAGDGADPEWADAFQAHLFQVAMSRCRERFEPRTWSAFEQVWIAGRPSAAVAAELGLSVESVYVAKSRALAALARIIRELSDDAPAFSSET